MSVPQSDTAKGKKFAVSYRNVMREVSQAVKRETAS